MAKTTPLKLSKVVLDFHSLAEVGKNGVYEGTFLIHADHPQHATVKKFFGESLKRFRDLKGLPKVTWKYAPIENGATKNENRETSGKEPYSHWGDDTLIIKGKSKFPVTLLDNMKNKVDGTPFYRGCLVNVVLNVTDTDEVTITTDSGKKETMILCLIYLAGVMFAGHGERLSSGGGDADFSDFETVEDVGSPAGSEEDEDLPF